MRAPSLVLALGVCVLGAACSSAPPHGVSAQSVQADIVFSETAQPANAAVPGAPLPADDTSVADFDFDDKAFLKRLPPSSRPAEPCPDAALNAFPEKEASANAIGTPAVGIYRWKIRGTQHIGSPPISFPINSMERRSIRNVKQVSPTEFTYDQVQKDTSANQFVVTTFKVRTESTETGVVADTRAGEPERGVAIARIERLDGRTGQRVSLFEPRPAVLLLPLPVAPGEHFTAAGVDPASLDTLEHDLTVTKRKQVDACGEMIDGWAAEGNQTFSSAERSYTRKYDVIVATQLGALLISEFIDVSGAGGRITATYSIGQLRPSPETQ